MAPIDNRSKTTKSLWQRFGVFVKDPRIKVIVYPLVAVLAVILAALGNFLWTEYGPGDIHLAVQVNDTSGKSLKGATVGFVQPITGGYQSQPTDPLGRVSFTIPHANMGSKITLNVVLDNFQASPDLPSLVLDKKNPQIAIELQRITINPPNPGNLPAAQHEPVAKKPDKTLARPKNSAFSATARGSAKGKIGPDPGTQAAAATPPTIAKVVPRADGPPTESETSPSLPDWIDAPWGLEVKNKRFTLTDQSLRCAATVDESLRIFKSQHNFIFEFSQSITSHEKDLELDVDCSQLADTKEWEVYMPITLSVQGQDSLSFTASMEKCHGRCKIPGRRGRLAGTIRRRSDEQIEVEFPGSLQGTFLLSLGQ
jgi:hypothetical protein